MQPWNNTWLLVIQLLLFFHGAEEYSTNLCPGAKGCRCSKDRKAQHEWGIYAKCRGPEPRVELLPLQNVTWLNLFECTFANISVLWSLRGANLGNRLSIRTFSDAAFNWNWLPDTCRKISISNDGKGIVFVSHNRSESSSSNLCSIRPSFNVTTVYISSAGYNSLPSCLPNSSTSLSFVNNPLKTLETRNLSSPTSFRWPARLRTLNLKKNQFENIGKHVFLDAPETLEQILIGSCQVPLQKFPQSWPPSHAVKYVSIILCGVKEISNGALAVLPNLLTLILNRNSLTMVPSRFPRGLQALSLSWNMLTNLDNVQWHLLNNLTIITLTGNKLRRVPSNLPTYLEMLFLNHNLIEFCGAGDFIYLRNLKELDMSNNKLLNMPENLPPTMKALMLNDNVIGLVRSPSSYEFCANCTVINLSHNPWVCDENMIKFLLWLGQRSIETRLTFGRKNPCAAVQTDFGNVKLRYFLEYMKYLKRRFPYCKYEIPTLFCNDTTTTKVPEIIPEGLISVVVTHFSNLLIFPDGLLRDSKKLRRLVLNYNQLVRFPRGLPSSLEILYLTNNRIPNISTEDQNTLNNLPNLKELYLDNNLINTIYDFQLLPMKSLRFLSILANPLHCDCSLQSLTVWFIRKYRDKYKPTDDLPVCASPSSQKGKPITYLIGAFEYKYKCAPRLCMWENMAGILNCSRTTQEERQNFTFEGSFFRSGKMPFIPNSTYWRELDLSGLNLTNGVIKVKQLQYLETINLADNFLNALPLLRLPQSLKNLVLRRNYITYLPPAYVVRIFLPNLKLLDLQQNRLITLDQNDVRILPLVNSVKLKGNPLLCDCRLRTLVTWIQTNKEKEEKMLRTDFQNLTCFEPFRLRGTLLTELSEVEYCRTFDFTMLVAFLVGVIVVVLIALFIVATCLQKRRKLKERQDIVQGFRDLLEREAMLPDPQDPETGVAEEMHYVYDAFVSYSEGYDEDFVYKLLEELEEHRERRICLHERDFIPGRGIADNIAESIVASRKVILVISRKYATSSWCQYEVQVALAQLHKRRRGRLLVPLLLEDVTKDEAYAGSVNTILSAITGLQVPEAQERPRVWREFWNKLNNALN